MGTGRDTTGGGRVIDGHFGARRSRRARRLDKGTIGAGMGRDHIEECVAEALWGCRHDPGMAALWAARLDVPDRPRTVVTEVLHLELDRAISNGPELGWSSEDMVQVVRRRAGSDAAAVLAGMLGGHHDRHGPGQKPGPRQERVRTRSSPPAPPRGDDHAVTTLLALTAVLRSLPSVPHLRGPSTRDADGAGGRRLAKVRALLAKAESTTFAAEAEALTAKAQQMISRHALADLLREAPTTSGTDRPSVRRLWLDAPYVQAKATLVAVVAEANRCRSILASELGFCTLVGATEDLDSVDLLVTSLLVQADLSMQARDGALPTGAEAAGVRPARSAGRTRSFRRSFLLSFATRIGERLTEATEAAITDSSARERLLPVLADRASAVQSAVDQLFPRLTARTATVTDLRGWAAGRAAADAARLRERHALDPDGA